MERGGERVRNLLLALLAIAIARDTSRPRLDVHVVAASRIAPTAVMVVAELVNPNEEWACPQITFIGPDGAKGSHEADCEDWHDGETYWTRRYAIGWEGEFVFTVELHKAGRLLARKTVSISIN